MAQEGTWTGCHFWVAVGRGGPWAPPGDPLAAAPPLGFSASAITKAASRSALLQRAEQVAAGYAAQEHEFWIGRSVFDDQISVYMDCVDYIVHVKACNRIVCYVSQNACTTSAFVVAAISVNLITGCSPALLINVAYDVK